MDRSPRAWSAALALGAAGALAAPAHAYQAVHVVAGGSGGALQAAIDAAADGDTVLVHGGSFSACLVQAKSLSIVSEPALSTTVAGLTIADLATGQRTVVSGLRVVAPALSGSGPAPECVVVDGCAGAVRLESIAGSLVAPNGNPALRVVDSGDVTLTGATLDGSDGVPSTASFDAWSPGEAIASTGSSIAAYDCVLRGGDGLDGTTVSPCSNPFTFFPTAGASAIELDAGSTLLVAGGTIAGGAGGDGVPARCDCFTAQLVPGSNGAAGGAALASAGGSTAYRVDAPLAGGAGGAGSGNVNCGSGPGGASAPGASGRPSVGSVVDLPGPPLRLVAPAIVRVGDPIALTVHGTPGNLVFLGRSFSTSWVLNVPAAGVLLLGAPVRRVPLGVLPSSGTLDVLLPPPTLPPGALAQQWYLEAFAFDALGAPRFGGGSVLTVVDAAF